MERGLGGEDNFQIVPDTPPILVEPELGRLAIKNWEAPAFRLWCIGRDITRRGNGSGVITRQALWEMVRAYKIPMTRRHFNRLLKGGEGLFWRAHEEQLYLRSIIKVARDLYDKASVEQDDPNRPGAYPVYLDPSGSLEHWEARLYAGWITHRSQKHELTIARETLSGLFGRTENTLRHWEASRLKRLIRVEANHAQCPDAGHYHPYLPEHAQPYLTWAQTPNGTWDYVPRLRWQIPNSYHTKHIEMHPHRGQGHKVRREINADIPADEKRGGPCRRYLTPEGLRKLYRNLKFRMGLRGDVNRPFYIYIGQQHRSKQRTWEINNVGFQVTHVNERLRPPIEEAHRAALDQYLMRWIPQWKEGK